MFTRMLSPMFARHLLAAVLLAASTLAAPAFAQSTRSLPADRGQHKYWLSEGLNRLVFWKLPEGNRAGAIQDRRGECRSCS